MAERGPGAVRAGRVTRWRAGGGGSKSSTWNAWATILPKRRVGCRAAASGPENGDGSEALEPRRRKPGGELRPGYPVRRIAPVGRWRHPVLLSDASHRERGTPPGLPVARDSSTSAENTDHRDSIASDGPTPMAMPKRAAGQPDTKLTSVLRTTLTKPQRDRTVVRTDSPGQGARHARGNDMSGADPIAVGLCARCRHARLVETPRSRFWLCERSRHDTSYERYPRLPMLECRGFEEGEPGRGTTSVADESPPDQK